MSSHEKHLPLQGAGFLSEVGKLFKPAVSVTPSGGLCRPSAKSKVYMKEKRNKTGRNYNQVVKELRLHFSEKKAMALLYKLEQQTVELVKLSRQIVELSREMEAKWSQKSV